MTKKRIEELREWARRLKDGEWDGDAQNANECLDEIERLQQQLHGYNRIVASIASVCHEESPLLKHFEEYEVKP